MNDYLNYQGYQIRIATVGPDVTAHVGLLGPLDPNTSRAAEPDTETPLGPFATAAAAIDAAKAAIDNREI